MRHFLRLKTGLWMLAVATLLGCSFGNDETNEPPAELVDFDEKIKVRQLWSHSVGDGWENLRLGLAPAVDGTTVYAAAYGGEVLAVNLDNGRTKWKTKTKLPLAAGPTIGASTVVVGSSDGDLVALNAQDGEERWRKNVGGEVLASPIIVRGLAIVRTVNGRLQAYDLRTGEQKWSNRFELPRLSLRGNAPPIVTGDYIVAGLDNGRVVALDIESGDTIWESIVTIPRGRTDLELLADVDAAVRAIGDRLFVVGYQGRIAMLSRDSGQILWANELSSYAGMGTDFSRLYITDSDSEVVALDQGTGATLWRQESMRARWLTAPTAIGRNVVVGDFEGYLHWLDNQTGELVARTRVSKEAMINPAVVSGETLLALSSDSKLVAFRIIPPKVQ